MRLAALADATVLAYPSVDEIFGLVPIEAILCGTPSIRDVIAFPKTQSASCLLTSAPAAASARQLRELGIKLAKSPKSEPS